MPLQSTFGALTYFKNVDTDPAYWINVLTPNITPSGLYFSTADTNNNVLGLALRVNQGGNLFPGYTQILSSNTALPFIGNSAFFGSNANTETASGEIFVNIINSNNTIYLTSTQETNRSGNTVRCATTRVISSSGVLLNTYVDPPNTSNPTFSLRDVADTLVLSNGSYVNIGRQNELAPTQSGTYITSYTGNSKNWTKYVTNANSNPNQILLNNSNNYVYTTLNGTLVEISANGNNIVNQTKISSISDFVLNDGYLDSSNNFYFSGTFSNNNKSYVSCLNYFNNIIWTKTPANSSYYVQFKEFYNNNVYCIMGIPPNPATANLAVHVVCLNLSSGNIIWQNKVGFYGNGIYANTYIIPDIKVNDTGMYLIGTLTRSNSAGATGSYVIKLPSDGSILGNGIINIFSGADTLNFGYNSSNLTLSNSTDIDVTTVNCNLSTPPSSNITTVAIPANTTSMFTSTVKQWI